MKEQRKEYPFIYKKYEKFGELEFNIPSKNDIVKELSSSREGISRNISALVMENIIEVEKN